jgi:hypothetical protein
VLLFRLEDEQGRWLSGRVDERAELKPGDRIPRGRGTLEVVEVRDEPEQVTLVVKRA